MGKAIKHLLFKSIETQQLADHLNAKKDHGLHPVMIVEDVCFCRIIILSLFS